MENIISLNSKTTEEKIEPNYNYTIHLRDGQDSEALGYLVLGHDFYGIARGEGILYNVWPKELIQSVTNNGPVPVGTFN